MTLHGLLLITAQQSASQGHFEALRRDAQAGELRVWRYPRYVFVACVVYLGRRFRILSKNNVFDGFSDRVLDGTHGRSEGSR